MAFEVGSAVAKIKADLTDFKAGMTEAKAQTDSFGNNLANIAGGIKDFGEKAALFTGVVAAGFGIGAKQVVDYASHLEQARIAYDAFTGSAEKGGEALKVVTEFARVTPFSLPDVVDAGKQLLGFGFSLDQLKEKLKEAGSLAAGTNQPMSAAIDLFARAREGIVNIRELGQFGIGKDALETFGVEFDKAGSAVNKSALLPAIEKLINSRFGDSLEKESKTFGGTMQNIQDDIGRLGSILIGVDPTNGDIIKNSIFERLKNAAQTFLSWLDSHMTEIQAVIGGAMTAVNNFFTALWMALQPLVTWIQANPTLVSEFLKGIALGLSALLVIGTVVALLNLLLNPLVWVVLGVTALYMAWTNNFLGIRTITTNFINWITPFITVAWTAIVDVLKIGWDIISGVWQVGTALLQGNWSGAWTAIKNLFTNTWNDLKGYFGNILDFIKGWGGSLVSSLVKPFEDAWNKISDLVNKIKGALDFTQRHSPSVLDIVQNGVALVNDALSELNIAPNMSPYATAGLGMGAPTPSINTGSNMQIVVNMDGAIISDEYGAQRMAQKVGDNIIKRLQQNIKF